MYRLYLDENLLDESFKQQLEENKEFKVAANWLGTTDKEGADAFLVSEEILGDGITRSLASIRPIICVDPKKLGVEFKIPDLDYDCLRHELHKIEPIIERINHLKENSILDSNDPFLMGLAFIWTRDKELVPHVDRMFAKGYWYPYFDNHEIDGSAGTDTLDFLRNSGFLSSHVQEIAQTCPKCHGIIILLRDGCVDCGSTDIMEENMVHHFACGYQAAESKFIAQNSEFLSELWCPKCHKPLRHYSVDYDKPTIIYTCQKCHHENYETRVMGKCLGCHATFKGEESPRSEIKKYRMTDLGVKALFDKEVNLFNLRKFLGQYVDVVPFDSFMIMSQKLSYVRDKLPLLLVRLSLRHDKSGSDDGLITDAKMILEIGRGVARHIRKSDLVALHRGALHILFVGGEGAGGNILLNKEGIRQMLSDDAMKRLVVDEMDLDTFLESAMGS